jgi:hypothetical protein
MIPLAGVVSGCYEPSGSRELPKSHICYNNLKQLDWAKEEFAKERNAQIVLGQEPTLAQVSPYIRGGLISLRCPSGGKYSVNTLNKPASCSLHGTTNDLMESFVIEEGQKKP